MPIDVACPVCGAGYKLKDEFAGRKVRCPKCQNVIQVPEPMPVAEIAEDEPQYEVEPDYRDERPDRSTRAEVDPVFDLDKYLLRQKLWAIMDKYTVADEDGEPVMYVERPVYLAAGCLAMMAGFAVMGILGALVAFVAAALPKDAAVIAGIILGIGVIAVGLVVIIALYPKRHIHFYADKKMTEPLLKVLQDRKFILVNMTYTLVDPDGEVICKFRKNYLYNLFRKRWYIYRPDGELWCVVKEDSIILSLLRRTTGIILDEIPLLGLALAAALRTNFVFLRPGDDEHLGMFNRRLTLLDRYVLDMSDDEDRHVDRRVAVAMGVLLDTGERR